jgi:hypothetical protein
MSILHYRDLRHYGGLEGLHGRQAPYLWIISMKLLKNWWRAGPTKTIKERRDPSLRDEHPSPLVRRVVELFTQHGLDRIEGVRDELLKWLNGEMYRPGLERQPRPPDTVQSWSRAELALVKLYLESLPRDQFTLDDWMLVCDYLSHRYLDPSDLRTEAEWLASRAVVMGKIKESLEHPEEVAERREIDSIKNEERVRRHKEREGLLKNSYNMSYNDFKSVIIPLLISMRVIEHNCDNASLFHRTGDVKLDSFDRWMADVNIGTMLRRNYELLVRARNANHKLAKFIVRRDCNCLKSLDEKTVDIDGLIKAFEGRDNTLPTIPPIETPCIKRGCESACNISISIIHNSESCVSDEFKKKIDMILGQSNNHLPIDWREIIINNGST